jgi:hypothetical protein
MKERKPAQCITTHNTHDKTEGGIVIEHTSAHAHEQGERGENRSWVHVWGATALKVDHEESLQSPD